jgi:hypothetical protein
LAIGAPDNAAGRGSVNVIYGCVMGLHPILGAQNRLFHQDVPGLGDAAPDKKFGYALAAGDFNNDGRDDLAIGVPNATLVIGAARWGLAGEVVVLLAGVY